MGLLHLKCSYKFQQWNKKVPVQVSYFLIMMAQCNASNFIDVKIKSPMTAIK